MTWRVIKTLSCGCELAELLTVSGPAYVTDLRPVARCVYHLCRKCGDVPSADSEPDRLCNGCMEDA